MALDPGTLEEFKQLSELLRFYTNLVLQTVTFVLTATSGVIAYVVKEPENSPRGTYGFAIPAALCLGMGIGFLINIPSALELVYRLRALTQMLKFGLAPHGTILVGSLAFFGIVLTATAVVLAVLLVKLRPKSPTEPSV